MKISIGLALAASLALSGCQTISAINAAFALNAPNPITPKAVYDAKVIYDTAEALAIQYIRLPLCTRHAAPCSDAGVSAQLKTAGPIARTALNKAAVFARDYPTLTTPVLVNEAKDLYGQYTSATAAFQSIEATNGVQ